MSKMRQKMKEQLKKRMAESNSRKSSGSGTGIFKGDNLKFFMPKADHSYIVDIIPYIAGKNSPVDASGEPKNPAGDWAYVNEFWQHSNVGPDEKGKVACALMNWNKPCPICEHRKKLIKEDGDEQLIRQLKPSLRCAYNVICYTGDEEAKGIQIWSLSRYYSENNFQELAKKVTRGGSGNADSFIYYMDQEDGKSIVFTQKGKNDMFKLTGIRFDDRDYTISDDLINKTYNLEDLLTNALPKNGDQIDFQAFYKKITEFYWGKEVVDNDEDNEEQEEEIVEEKQEEIVEDNDEQEEEVIEEKTVEKKKRKRRTKKVKSEKSIKDYDFEDMDKEEMIETLNKLNVDLGVDLDDLDEDDLFFAIADYIEELD